ncbi:MAG: methyltransferase [Anaerolineae bacterium]|nr:methyltransferase [Anaerolineae bacterium]
MDEANSPPAMDVIGRLTGAVAPALALLAGCQLDIFTVLADGARSAEQVAAALGVELPKLRALLYVLVSSSLLTVDQGRFANSPEAQYYLVKGSPGHIGAAPEFWSLLWGTAFQTAESVRSGMGQAQRDFDYRRTPPEKLERIFRLLHDGAVEHGRSLIERYDFSTVASILDAGGGSGGLAMALVEALPQVNAAVADLPSVTPITRRFVEQSAAAQRIQIISADILRAPPEGVYDAAVLRAVIQVLSAEDAQLVLNNVGRAVKPGGIIYIIGWVLDDSRLSPPGAVMTNLFLMNAYHGGMSYTEAEHCQWLEEAGFEACRRVMLPDTLSIISAQKRP